MYLDDSGLGVTPLRMVPIPAGPHLLRCLNGDSLRWSMAVYAESLSAAAGENITRVNAVPVLRRIQIIPFGALMETGGKRAGTTPAEIELRGAVPIVFSRQYYEGSAAVVTGDTTIVLAPLRVEAPDIPRSPYLAEVNFRNPLPIYLTAGTAVVAGAVAAYFKLKADGEYADYAPGGGVGVSPEAYRNDNRAGAAFVICQVSILGLAFLLFSR